ncbi:MAG: bifunctional 4'-phosphopantothenoylcysteine decarboxylase/phosphopantothenoylcysteine synthetase, partial [Chloroflexota bacterium]|nr:bifunctional 4'-phosphopantothenoylcysteine decarboxylase/phosphopantothenoylcysteine synthetase [Chloroflexota bacterium]
LPSADVLIMAAAPADFRVPDPAPRKIRKSAAPTQLTLCPTPDILLSTLPARRPGAVVVGFALDAGGDAVSGGRHKLSAKSLDLVVVNDASEPGAGFAVDTNRATLLSRDGSAEELPLMPKADLAELILDRIERLLHER